MEAGRAIGSCQIFICIGRAEWRTVWVVAKLAGWIAGWLAAKLAASLALQLAAWLAVQLAAWYAWLAGVLPRVLLAASLVAGLQSI